MTDEDHRWRPKVSRRIGRFAHGTRRPERSSSPRVLSGSVSMIYRLRPSRC